MKCLICGKEMADPKLGIEVRGFGKVCSLDCMIKVVEDMKKDVKKYETGNNKL